jgi:hypothetical protein
VLFIVLHITEIESRDYLTFYRIPLAEHFGVALYSGASPFIANEDNFS